MKRNQEHYRGCLIGGAVGDAFGSAVEFLSIDAIREKYGKGGITDHSGDSDSTGSITGNILGAYLGKNSIPKGESICSLLCLASRNIQRGSSFYS